MFELKRAAVPELRFGSGWRTRRPIGEGAARAVAIVFALLVSVALFFVLPVVLTSAADRYIGSPLVSNLVEKVLRLGLILGYVVAISFLPDVKRVFGYHGAEHKTVNAYEAGVDLTVSNVRRWCRIIAPSSRTATRGRWPRRGTAQRWE